MITFYTRDFLIAKENCMLRDINILSQQLLERLANSIHDRDQNNKQFCFNINEVHVVETWIKELLNEYKKNWTDY